MAASILGGIIGLSVGLLAQSWPAAGVLAVIGFVAGRVIGQRDAHVEGPPPPSLEDLGLSEPPPPLRPEEALPPPPTRAEVERAARQRFAEHLCALFAAVALADGDTSRDEVRVVREYFEETLRFSTTELEDVRIALKRALAGPVEVDRAARACREELPGGDRLLLLNALYELALADGQIRRPASELLQRIATALEISPDEHRAIRALFFPGGEAHYARLGLDASASDEEVKSAFRKLAAANHPDRVAHLGPGPAEAATRRFREIKDAYDAIRLLRGS